MNLVLDAARLAVGSERAAAHASLVQSPVRTDRPQLAGPHQRRLAQIGPEHFDVVETHLHDQALADRALVVAVPHPRAVHQPLPTPDEFGGFSNGGGVFLVDPEQSNVQVAVVVGVVVGGRPLDDGATDVAVVGVVCSVGDGCGRSCPPHADAAPTSATAANTTRKRLSMESPSVVLGWFAQHAALLRPTDGNADTRRCSSTSGTIGSSVNADAT